MKYCSNCGNELNDAAVVCPSCGVSQKQENAVTDSGSFGWSVLGCCIPIVGLILFLVWKDQKPKTAKMAGIGALVSVVLIVLFYVLLFAIGYMGVMSVAAL